MIETQCAICKEKEQLKVLYPERIPEKKVSEKIYSARRTPDRMHFRFVICTRCSLIFSNPIFETKKIVSLYKKSRFTYNIEADYLRKTYIKYLRQILHNRDTRKLSLLEIGCGNGFFLEEVYNMGFKTIQGVEPGKPAVQKASSYIKKNIIIDIFRSGLFKKNTFDIICCFHTLDHVIDIDSFLKAAYNILKKDGIIFFIVHNTDGLSVKLLGEKSPIFDIEHIYLFNPQTLQRLFKAYRFSSISIFSILNTYPLLYWMRLFPFPQKLKVLILKLLSVTKLGYIPIPLSAGNIGITAKK